jgi:hypothetical protein
MLRWVSVHKAVSWRLSELGDRDEVLMELATLGHTRDVPVGWRCSCDKTGTSVTVLTMYGELTIPLLFGYMRQEFIPIVEQAPPVPGESQTMRLRRLAEDNTLVRRCAILLGRPELRAAWHLDEEEADEDESPSGPDASVWHEAVLRWLIRMALNEVPRCRLNMHATELAPYARDFLKAALPKTVKLPSESNVRQFIGKQKSLFKLGR